MRKLSFIAVILLTTALFSCKKTSTSNPSNPSSSSISNFILNGVSYTATDPTIKTVISATWDSTDNYLFCTGWDSTGLWGSVGITFPFKPTSNKSWNIQYGGVTDSTCNINAGYESGSDVYLSNPPSGVTQKVNVIVNNGKLTVTFSNVTMSLGTLYNSNQPLYTTLSGTLTDN